MDIFLKLSWIRDNNRVIPLFSFVGFSFSYYLFLGSSSTSVFFFISCLFPSFVCISFPIPCLFSLLDILWIDHFWDCWEFLKRLLIFLTSCQGISEKTYIKDWDWNLHGRPAFSFYYFSLSFISYSLLSSLSFSLEKLEI